MTSDEFKLPPQLREAFSEIDRRFADLMLELAESTSQHLWFAAALVSQQTRLQHVCVYLPHLSDPEFAAQILEDETDVTLPSPKEVLAALSSARIVGKAGESHPLILDHAGRLYLYRYWQYEQDLATFIRARTVPLEQVAADVASESIKTYLGGNEESEIDWQKVAAAVALCKRFCVVSGGPGTGKTRTIGVILALLIEQLQLEKSAIKLVAPTGKAAVRLQESIKAIKTELKFPDAIAASIPEEASTVHRLLGTRPHSPYFRHNAENPLDVDVVVLDEASMVDLPLITKLVQALPDHARLILLGDHCQLASVEAGAVLADICDAGSGGLAPDLVQQIHALTGYPLPSEQNVNNPSGVQDCVVYLQKNYRFKDGGILELSQAVNAGEGSTAFNLLTSRKHDEIQWHALTEGGLSRAILDRFTGYPTSLRVSEVFAQFNLFRILCAVRHGPHGVRQINAWIERYVREKSGMPQAEEWYVGQPILITRNDYSVGLFNGDVGIILPDPEANNELRAYFPVPDDDFRKVRPFRLPEYELAYAMTVHKSQGSEFENVMLLLPEQDSPVLTRELIYTGITRATQRVEVWGMEDVFRTAVSRRIRRSSGLRDGLLKNHSSR